MAGDTEEDLNIVQRIINWRVSAAMEPHPPNETLLKLQQPLVDLLSKYYFRLEVDGWEHVPDETCLVDRRALRRRADHGRLDAGQRLARRTSRASGTCTAPRTTC